MNRRGLLKSVLFALFAWPLRKLIVKKPELTLTWLDHNGEPFEPRIFDAGGSKPVWSRISSFFDMSLDEGTRWKEKIGTATWWECDKHGICEFHFWREGEEWPDNPNVMDAMDVLGTWEPVFCVQTDSTVGALANGIGEAWSMPSSEDV